MTLHASTAGLISLLPTMVAVGMVVSTHKEMLTAKDSSGKRIREGKYIVKVSKGNETEYAGPFVARADAAKYARKVKSRYPAYKVSVTT